jgi:membrane peptidoglycan carboxypeptidase
VLSKDQILEMYLNSVYWGRGGGTQIAGVAEAARWYFGEPVEDLTLEQSALLVGMIPAPNVFHPRRNPAAARARRNVVLSNMVTTGVLNSAVAARAKRAPLAVVPGTPEPQRYPSYVSTVRDWLVSRLPPHALEQQGLTVMTGLDLAWQDAAEQHLGAAIGDLERYLGRRDEPLQGAFVAIEPGTGLMRAVVGGREPGLSGDFNRATRALRQPGSAIKPIVYSTALDPDRPGARFTPASTVPDLRRSFDTPEGPWSPRNDEGDYHDTVTLAKALAKSLNVATANLVQAVTPRAVAREAERFGLMGMKPVASIGLGTNEVTLAGLTDAYATFPASGVRHPAIPVRLLLDARGVVRGAAAPPPVTVLTRPTAELMRGLLEDVVIFGVSYPLRAQYGWTRPIGGKTGTTNDTKDAWFIGFTPEVVAGVWVGWDRPQPITRPAAESALPVWSQVMQALIGDDPPLPFEDSGATELKWIDPWSGGLARPDCPSPLRVPFIKGTGPTQLCSRDHASDWARIAAQRSADSTGAAADSAAMDTALAR